MTLRTFEIEPTAPQRGSVIWLHGLGATHHDFLPVVRELSAPYLRFVFPAAPVRPVTLYGQMLRPAWYDILSFARGAPQENEAHLQESRLELERLVAQEQARGVPPGRVVLAGFSQGGAMALHAALRSRQPLAGVLVISGYLPAAQALRAEAPVFRTDVPILFCHGRQDPVVPYAGGRVSYELVRALGYDARWAEFDVGHTMNLTEVQAIARWLASAFAAEPG